jgi:catechol 2,3-dioxygenase-like lactoylglutathione lyase family enzyme
VSIVITGAHAIIYSTDADADRAFLRDLLGTTTVDAGGGWLILALPPAEVAVHPTDGPPRHELYLLCDDIEATHAALVARGVVVEGGISDQGWGRLITLRLPSGGPLGVYEPRHPVAAGS